MDPFRRILDEANRLEAIDGLQAKVKCINAIVLSCQSPLWQFLESIKKYNGVLDVAG